MDLDVGNPTPSRHVHKQLIPVVLSVLPALAAPSPLVSVKKNKNPIAGRYIGTFKDDTDGFFGFSFLFNRISSHSGVTHDEWDILNSYAGTFSDADVELLRSLPNVASIEEDGYVHTQAITTQ